ncbi:MAG: cytochrome ubiquinol oxidase subunit I [Pseudomonadota bacterium]
MLLTSWIGMVWLWSQRSDGLPRWLLGVLVLMTFSGWLATLAGWYTTEIGRQPWLVQGVMTTADALGPVPPGMIATTLLAYLFLYTALIVAYVSVVFYLARKAATGEPA